MRHLAVVIFHERAVRIVGAGRTLRIADVPTQPLRFAAPVNILIGLPGIRAAAAKTERLKAHRLERDVTGEDHQVSPGNSAAILLLDRPEKPARLVETDVVRPAIERRKTLLPAP